MYFSLQKPTNIYRSKNLTINFNTYYRSPNRQNFFQIQPFFHSKFNSTTASQSFSNEPHTRSTISIPRKKTQLRIGHELKKKKKNWSRWTLKLAITRNLNRLEKKDQVGIFWHDLLDTYPRGRERVEEKEENGRDVEGAMSGRGKRRGLGRRW